VNPFAEKLRTSWRTLRFRLAAWNALVVVLTAVVTLVGLRQGVRWTLLHELDQILLEDTSEIVLALQDTRGRKFSMLTEILNRKAEGHRHHGWFVKLVDHREEVVWQSDGAPVESEAIDAASAVPRTIDDRRVVRREVRGDDRIAAMIVGARLDLLRADLARIDRLVMIAACGVLLAAPAIGYWLARRAARTIGQIIETAGRLRPSHLDERLPLQGTGDELDQLAQTVNGLLDRIAAYLQQRRDFLANAAHELRTPLAAIRSSVEVALGGNRSPQEYRDLLVDIIDQGTALEALVNQLLLLSESETEQFKSASETVQLDQLVSRAVEMFRGVAEAKGLELTADRISPVVVAGRRNPLRQVVNNLIDNAVKYTQEGGRIEVALERDDARHAARLTVTDNGPGIAPADLSRIFERFFRADRSRTREGGEHGNGLGLSICQAVLAAHGGEIACRSTPGAGAEFIATLPLTEQPPLPAAPLKVRQGTCP
jgi:heavy metal sensor kinase